MRLNYLIKNYNKKKLAKIFTLSIFAVGFIVFGIFNYSIFSFSADEIINNTYYVAYNGVDSPSKDGSGDSPWKTVEYALSVVGGGNTVILKDGFYSPIVVSTGCGTADSHTIIKAENKWKAQIFGSIDSNISTTSNCEYVEIDGFEIAGAQSGAIKVNGNYSTIKNNYIHGNSENGISANNLTGTVIERNLIEFNGYDTQNHHGIYADGDGLLIKNNIVRHNAADGMYLSPSLTNSHIENNVIHKNEYNSGIYVASPANGGNNVIANNTIATNKTGLTLSGGNVGVIANNLLWSNTTQTSGASNATALNNAVSNPTTSDLIGPKSVTVTADPALIYLSNGAYFLKANSPAIGAGNGTYLPKTDFWGRSQPASPYIGAFPYELRLTKYGGLVESSPSYGLPHLIPGTSEYEDSFYLDWYYGRGYGYPPAGKVYYGIDYWIF